MPVSSFRALHDNAEPLLLPNAWDAGSARVIENAGAAAIATTSAGLAWSKGYADGELLPPEQLFTAIRDIARVIAVPLTVDIEAGYSSDPAAVGKVVTGVIEFGAVGVNIEDGEGPPDALCRKIEAARQAAVAAGADLFVNARTDVYLHGLAEGDAAVEEVIRRGALYRGAGCDGLFVPALRDKDAILAIAAAVDGVAFNLLAVPGLPAISLLRDWGVRRISAGSGIAKSTLALTQRLATEFLGGSLDALFAQPSNYADLNGLFSHPR